MDNAFFLPCAFSIIAVASPSSSCHRDFFGRPIDLGQCSVVMVMNPIVINKILTTSVFSNIIE